jgi:Fe2+ or Zn2+ uptake regulation protein
MTVYNTVKLFTRKGVVIPIIIEDKELRYDINTSFHGHFRCQKCGAVHDVFDVEEPKNPADLAGFKVAQHHVYYMGICKQCIDNTN